MDLEGEIDRLYGLPLDEFVAERGELTKRLRADGDRDGAERVKALRKPTLGAWAINQATRRRAKERDELLAAGEQLRAAHEALLSGGDAAALRDASRDERALVSALVDTAAAIATEAGKGGPALEERLRNTLHAAALDDEVREELSAGRVIREREASGLGMLGEAARTAKQGTPDDTRARATAEQREREAAERQLAEELEAVQTELERAQAALTEATSAREQAGTRVEAARAELEEARQAETEARRAQRAREGEVQRLERRLQRLRPD